jgi:hypothetical protein
MSKTFRPWDVDQVWLLPPSIQDLVPSGHVAHFVRDTVRTGLELSRIMDVYDEERGFPPYHPGMMTYSTTAVSVVPPPMSIVRTRTERVSPRMRPVKWTQSAALSPILRTSEKTIASCDATASSRRIFSFRLFARLLLIWILVVGHLMLL